MKKQEKSVTMLTPFSESSNAIDRTNRQLNESMQLTDRQIAKTLNFLRKKSTIGKV